MLAESVVLIASIASLAHDSLRAGKSEEQVRDLAHGPVELLREVLLHIIIDDEQQQLAHTVRIILEMLLLLKGFLLAWDCSMCPDALLELPLPKFPKHSPNRCWHLQRPQSRYLLYEVRSCEQFLRDNSHILSQEPWLWIQDCLDSLPYMTNLIDFNPWSAGKTYQSVRPTPPCCKWFW